jgi:hypothetical protein
MKVLYDDGQERVKLSQKMLIGHVADPDPKDPYVWGLLYPDPYFLVRGTDPDPYIIKQKM